MTLIPSRDLIETAEKACGEFNIERRGSTLPTDFRAMTSRNEIPENTDVPTVRPSTLHGRGLFAMRDYTTGQSIVQDLHTTSLQMFINAGTVLKMDRDTMASASYDECRASIANYDTRCILEANVTREEYYDENFRIQSSSLVALRDIKKDDELLDTYPALVWLKKLGQSANTDRYIYEVFQRGHPKLNPNATIMEKVAANFAVRTFANVIMLKAVLLKDHAACAAVEPYAREYLAKMALK